MSGEVQLTDEEVEQHVCCMKRHLCRDEHFHQRDVERILSARLAAQPTDTARPSLWRCEVRTHDTARCIPTKHYGLPREEER